MKDGPWAWVPHAVIDLIPEIGPTPFAVYSVLAKYANEKQQCWPSIATIQSVVRIRRENIWRVLQKLQQHNLICIEQRSKESGAQTSNLYTLLCIPPISPVAPEAPPPVAPEAPGGSARAQHPPLRQRHHELDSVELDSTNQHPPNPPSAPGGLFERFLKAYPRADRPGYAKRAWNRAIQNGADPEGIIERAALFAASHEGRSKDCPDASAWLRGERWREAPATWSGFDEHAHGLKLAEEATKALGGKPKPKDPGLKNWREDFHSAKEAATDANGS